MGARTRAALFLATILLIWAIVTRLGLWPRYVLPGPVEVGRSLVAVTRDGRLAHAVLISVRRLAIGYGISVGAGVLIGVACARARRLREAIGPVLLGLQALPSVCWLPLALLWFGLGEAAVLFVVVMGSVLSIALATEGAVRAVPPLYVRAGRTLGARRLRLYLGVILPAALPGIVTGLRLGWTFAWRSLMAGELLHVAGGLGQLLTLGRELNDMALVIGVMVVIICLGLAFDRFAFASVEGRIHDRWGTA